MGALLAAGIPAVNSVALPSLPGNGPSISAPATGTISEPCATPHAQFGFALGDKLGSLGAANAKWSDDLWHKYQQYVGRVRAMAPSGLNLRDCDRWLWDQDKQRDLQKELAGRPGHRIAGPLQPFATTKAPRSA